MRTGLKDISSFQALSGTGDKAGEQEGVIAYILVTMKTVMRAYLRSNVSPLTSGSSSTPTLYLDKINVRTTTLSASNNLKETRISTWPSRQRPSLFAPSPDASSGTCNEMNEFMTRKHFSGWGQPYMS